MILIFLLALFAVTTVAILLCTSHQATQWGKGSKPAPVVAGVGYVSKRATGKGVFVVGTCVAAGLLVMATMGCGTLPDSAKSDRQIAEEAVACLGAGYGETTVIAVMQSYDREQLVNYRDSNCEDDEAPAARDDSEPGSGRGGLFGFLGSSCAGCSNVQEMLDEYEANPLRAEQRYRGRTMVVGGKIEAIKEDWAVPPQPVVRLKNKVTLSFANRARSWLLGKRVGDTIEAQCLIVGFQRYSLGGRDGAPILEQCVPPESN